MPPEASPSLPEGVPAELYDSALPADAPGAWIREALERDAAVQAAGDTSDGLSDEMVLAGPAEAEQPTLVQSDAEPGARFHTKRCCADPQLEVRWTDGLREFAFLTFWCQTCATELIVLDPPGYDRPESDPERTAPDVPVPVVDLGAFQALVRLVDSGGQVADMVAAQAANLGDPHTAEHADRVRADHQALEELVKQLLPYTRAVDGDTGGHAPLDVHSLRTAGIDPTGVQPREHSVPCFTCDEPTWNLAAHCDIHYRQPNVLGRLLTEQVPA